ncbi:MAG: hemerythrin domain-containing protein [Planctomycetia bacterium]
MAPIDRSDPIILGHVLSEHQDLFRRIMAVRHALAAEPPSGDDRLAPLASLPSLEHCLRSLRDHLEAHFRQEETGGFLEEAVTRMPRLGPSVAAVIAQHPALLAELDALIASLRSSADSTLAWQQAAHAFETFAANLMAHERSENAVVQEGYNEDLGLVD